MLRAQPPVRSPVRFSGLLAGAADILGAGVGLRVLPGKIGELYEAESVFLLDSGKSALLLAMHLACPGGTIACPAYACIDVAAVALGAGVRLRLYDVDPATLSVDLQSLDAALGRGCDAVLTAPLWGYPVDNAAVRRICDRHGVPLIEDAAQAAGASIGERLAGSFGDLSVLSFGRGKGSSGGGGGALLVRSPRFSDRLGIVAGGLGEPGSGVSNWLAAWAQLILARPRLYWIPVSIPWLHLGEMVYRPVKRPRQMSRASAGMAADSIALLRSNAAARREVAGRLDEMMSVAQGCAPVRCIAGSSGGYLRYAVLDVTGNRRTFRAFGIERGYPLTVDQQEPAQAVLEAGEVAPLGARRLKDTLFTFPTHSRLTTADYDGFDRWIHNVPG